MTEYEYGKLEGQIEMLKHRLDLLEANSRLSASTVQPLVGPPDVDKGEPAALARPEMLAKLKTVMKEELADYTRIAGDVTVAQYLSSFVTQVLQRMSELDQGPIAECVSEDEVEAKGNANQFDNRI
jgi:hypothetical protein